MPNENNFQHDELSRKSPGERLTTAELTVGALPESPAWFESMAQCGTALSQAGVRAVVFLHGSIRGSDVFGMQRLDEVGGLKRGFPTASARSANARSTRPKTSQRCTPTMLR